MNTYSHFLLTAVLRKPLKHAVEKTKSLPPVSTSALFIGSIIPDSLLTILAIFFGVVDLSRGNFVGDGEGSLLWKLFNEWYFTNPWVISAQQLFHSPIMVAIFIALGYFLWKRNIRGGGWFFWLSCAAMLHTLIDIPLHYNDGPLLLWPLNWDLRYYSPVSYWDSDHYGVPAMIYEHFMDIVFIGILIARRRGAIWQQSWVWVAIFGIPLVILIVLQIAGVFN